MYCVKSSLSVLSYHSIIIVYSSWNITIQSLVLKYLVQVYLQVPVISPCDNLIIFAESTLKKKKKMLQTNINTGNPVYVLQSIYEDYLTYQSTVDIWLV